MLFVSVFPSIAPGLDSLKADSLVILTYWLAVDEPRGAAFFEKSRSLHRRRTKRPRTRTQKGDISNEVRKGTFLLSFDKGQRVGLTLFRTWE